MTNSKRTYWDNFEKEDICQEVYNKFMGDITQPLFNIVKKYCAGLGPERSRNINSLSEVEWLTNRISILHREREASIMKGHQELRALQAKPKLKEMSQEERIRDMPTWLLVMDLMRRVDSRIMKLERTIRNA